MAEEEAKNLETPVVEEPTTEEAPAETEEKFAKAGKKSKKHIEEVRAEEERQARKAEAAAEPEKKAGPKPVTRSRLERRGKNYRKANEKVEKGKAYSLEEAIKLAIETSPVKFDATLEMHFRLGVLSSPRLISLRLLRLPAQILLKTKNSPSALIKNSSTSTFLSQLHSTCQSSVSMHACSVLRV